MIDMASTGLKISERFSNKPIKKMVYFQNFSSALIGAYEVDNNPHIFLIRVNQHIQKIYRHFDGTLNHYSPMLFAANQEQN